MERDKKVLVASFGNKYMGDDGFGQRVIEVLLTRDLPEDVELRDAGLCGVTLAPELGDYGVVIFVDAVRKGGKPGTVYRSEIKEGQVKELRPEEAMNSFTFSVHETRLEDLLFFAKAIGTLPTKIIVIGCEVLEVKLGESLSEGVANGVRRAVELILEELWRYREGK